MEKILEYGKIVLAGKEFNLGLLGIILVISFILIILCVVLSKKFGMIKKKEKKHVDKTERLITSKGSAS